MAEIIRSAHVVPGSKAGWFCINNYIDWDQYNTLYDLDSSEERLAAGIRETEAISKTLKEEAADRLKEREEAERKRARKLAKLKTRSRR
jgi:FMN phosphatase YigB (HAD superfamily)